MNNDKINYGLIKSTLVWIVSGDHDYPKTGSILVSEVEEMIVNVHLIKIKHHKKILHTNSHPLTVSSGFVVLPHCVSKFRCRRSLQIVNS